MRSVALSFGVQASHIAQLGGSRVGRPASAFCFWGRVAGRRWCTNLELLRRVCMPTLQRRATELSALVAAACPAAAIDVGGGCAASADRLAALFGTGADTRKLTAALRGACADPMHAHGTTGELGPSVLRRGVRVAMGSGTDPRSAQGLLGSRRSHSRALCRRGPEVG